MAIIIIIFNLTQLFVRDYIITDHDEFVLESIFIILFVIIIILPTLGILAVVSIVPFMITLTSKLFS